MSESDENQEEEQEAKGAPPYERGFFERVQFLAGEANPVLAWGLILVPLVLGLVGYGLKLDQLLFYTHVAAGAMWFGLILFLVTVIGPVMGSLDKEIAGAVSAKLTPKLVFFGFGMALSTPLIGTLLLQRWYGFGSLWAQVALVYGWGLFVIGVVGPHRLHLKMYYEGMKDKPDPEKMENLEETSAKIEVLEAILMLGIIAVMTFLRSPFPA